MNDNPTALATTSERKPPTLEDIDKKLDALKHSFAEQLGGLKVELETLRSELSTHDREKEALGENVAASNAIGETLKARIAELHTLMQDVGARGLQRHEQQNEKFNAIATTLGNHGQKLERIITVIEMMSGVRGAGPVKVAARRKSTPPKKPRA